MARRITYDQATKELCQGATVGLFSLIMAARVNSWKFGNDEYIFKKWTPGAPLTRKAKQLVTNVMVKYQDLHPQQSMKELDNFCTNLLGVGKSSLMRTRAEMRKTGKTQTPGKVRPNRHGKGTRMHKYDKATLTSIRQKIHAFFLRNEYPTSKKLLREINSDPDLPNFHRETLRHLLMDMKFSSAKRRRKFVLIDNTDITQWRRQYLRKIKAYRNDNRNIVYLDETWFSAEQKTEQCWDDKSIPCSTDASRKESAYGNKLRLILLHAASEAGFVLGCLRVLTSKKIAGNSEEMDDHEEMDGAYFENWFKNSLLPNIRPCSVIVMDSAPCNTVVEDQMPSIQWTKDKIRTWLTGHDIEWTEDLMKMELIALAEGLRPICGSYKVDILAREAGHDVLRQPPYHCELNPLKQAWDFVKEDVARNEGIATLKDVQQGVQNAIGKVTPQLWTAYLAYAVSEEEKMWKLDGLIDDMMDKLVGILSKNGSAGVEVEATIDSSGEEDAGVSP